MKLIEIMIMTMITLTEWEVGAADEDETKCVDETGRSATAESRSHDDANICRKKEKRKRGSKMAARLAGVNDVEEHVLEKQAERMECNHDEAEQEAAAKAKQKTGKAAGKGKDQQAGKSKGLAGRPSVAAAIAHRRRAAACRRAD